MTAHNKAATKSASKGHDGAQNSDFALRLARQHVRQAAVILSGMGEEESRVSWLLEDCATMLDRPAKFFRRSRRTSTD